MSERTDAHTAATSPGTYGYCSWHRGVADDVRLVQVEEAGSGPASFGNKSACGPCRDTYHLTPLADQP